MKKNERREMTYFPKQLDNAVNERFGLEVNCKSELDFFGSMGYRTTFIAESPLREQIDNFIAGYIAGNIELRERILAL